LLAGAGFYHPYLFANAVGGRLPMLLAIIFAVLFRQNATLSRNPKLLFI
jgi:hypothetical protein